ncbi:hypothetical protein GMDG_07538 [Pseudogymnoascus destructans 20631-21]|uniref:CCHC-type domain-containing protein n=1 Tax=Pseudogymnoascus destructans (strain ATCC MYA-4855 / 20631-21) TaxID=658429 RepID=L8FXJ5_PSED2|nr:hypothetical protein GMDG_07538 [Pseudogymnoascus destructans 20631-21]
MTLWAVALFRGPASEWISNYLADYMNYRTPDGKCNTLASQGTKEIFVSWNGFLKTLKANFRDIDERRNAVRALQALKQRRSAVAYTAEFQQHATLTNWGDEAICDQFYAGLKDHVKDEISRSNKPDDLTEMIELAQKIDNCHYKRQLEKKGGPPSQHWTQKRRQTKSHWPQPMELDATFKPNGKPHNPNKERQFQERLCFNCNKPGHIARNCRQSKKGNGGRKYGKQLNATWQGQGGYKAPRGQLCATLKGKENWSITTQDLEEFHLSNREDKNDNKELTSSQKHQLQAFEKTSSKTLFKEQLPGAVRTFKEAMLQETVDQEIPVPKPPMSWQDTTQDWEVAIRTMGCRPEYPHQQESIPREERGTRVVEAHERLHREAE